MLTLITSQIRLDFPELDFPELYFPELDFLGAADYGLDPFPALTGPTHSVGLRTQGNIQIIKMLICIIVSSCPEPYKICIIVSSCPEPYQIY